MRRPDELYRKSNRVDAHQAITTSVEAVDATNSVHYFGDGVAGELIAEYVQADLLARVDAKL